MLNSSEPSYIRIERNTAQQPVPQNAQQTLASTRNKREEDIALLMSVVPSIIKMLKHRVQHSSDADQAQSESELGLPQIKVLSALGDGECVMSDLARRFDVSGPTMTRTVDILVERGYAQRWRDAEDRRHVYLRLTDIGQKIRAKIRGQYTQAIRDFLKPLADDELETVVLAGKYLSTLLDESGKPTRPPLRGSAQKLE